MRCAVAMMIALSLAALARRRMERASFVEGLPEAHVEPYERDDDAPLDSTEAASLGKAFLAQLRGGS